MNSNLVCYVKNRTKVCVLFNKKSFNSFTNFSLIEDIASIDKGYYLDNTLNKIIYMSYNKYYSDFYRFCFMTNKKINKKFMLLHDFQIIIESYNTNFMNIKYTLYKNILILANYYKNFKLIKHNSIKKISSSNFIMNEGKSSVTTPIKYESNYKKNMILNNLKSTEKKKFEFSLNKDIKKIEYINRNVFNEDISISSNNQSINNVKEINIFITDIEYNFDNKLTIVGVDFNCNFINIYTNLNKELYIELKKTIKVNNYFKFNDLSFVNQANNKVFKLIYHLKSKLLLLNEYENTVYYFSKSVKSLNTNIDIFNPFYELKILNNNNYYCKKSLIIDLDYNKNLFIHNKKFYKLIVNYVIDKDEYDNNENAILYFNDKINLEYVDYRNIEIKNLAYLQYLILIRSVKLFSSYINLINIYLVNILEDNKNINIHLYSNKNYCSKNNHVLYDFIIQDYLGNKFKLKCINYSDNSIFDNLINIYCIHKLNFKHIHEFISSNYLELKIYNCYIEYDKSTVYTSKYTIIIVSF